MKNWTTQTNFVPICAAIWFMELVSEGQFADPTNVNCRQSVNGEGVSPTTSRTKENLHPSLPTPTPETSDSGSHPVDLIY